MFLAASAIDVFMVLWYAASGEFRYVPAMAYSVIVALLSFVSFSMTLSQVSLVVPYLLGNAAGTWAGMKINQRKQRREQEKPVRDRAGTTADAERVG